MDEFRPGAEGFDGGDTAIHELRAAGGEDGVLRQVGKEPGNYRIDTAGGSSRSGAFREVRVIL